MMHNDEDIIAIDHEQESVPAMPEAAVEQDLDHQGDTSLSNRAHDTSSESPRSDHLALILRDGLDMPIDGLTFIATFPSGEVCTAESTKLGAIALPMPPQATGEVKLEVKDATGSQQIVCTVDLDKCNGAVIVRSPKTKAKIALQPHQQTVSTRVNAPPARKVTPQAKAAPSSQPEAKPKQVDTHASWWDANGAWRKAWDWITSNYHFFGQAQAATPSESEAVKGLSNAGQPLAAVLGPEVPGKDNLRLGRNNIYRQPILEASKRLGLIPQALCALMDCEAGKVTEKLPLLNKDGTPMKDKKGKPLFQIVRERWNAQAGNAESGAAGLTQFLASTWLTHVLVPGHYIHEKSVSNGWVRQEADAKGKKRWVFVLADGATTSEPYKKRGSDTNVKKCLAMRMDPSWSINAAADYGNANLKVLEKAGLKLSGLNDMERAKFMYLMHHEGEGCGPLFIRDKLRDRKDGVGGVARQKQVFILQLGSQGASKAAELIDRADGDVEAAYREWLAAYIDTKFDTSSKYFFVQPVDSRELSKLMSQVGGQKL
jgi:hypothetical protein